MSLYFCHVFASLVVPVDSLSCSYFSGSLQMALRVATFFLTTFRKPVRLRLATFSGRGAIMLGFHTSSCSLVSA